MVSKQEWLTFWWLSWNWQTKINDKDWQTKKAVIMATERSGLPFFVSNRLESPQCTECCCTVRALSSAPKDWPKFVTLISFFVWKLHTLRAHMKNAFSLEALVVCWVRYVNMKDVSRSCVSVSTVLWRCHLIPYRKLKAQNQQEYVYISQNMCTFYSQTLEHFFHIQVVELRTKIMQLYWCLRSQYLFILWTSIIIILFFVLLLSPLLL